MKRFFISERGSVSIYLLVIIAAMFMFNAVLIDFARLKIAEKQSENALKASLRSTFSAYDRSFREYGLFGVGLDKAEQLSMVGEVITRNITVTNGSKPHLSYIDLRLDAHSVKVNHLYSLAHHQVFEQQVMQEMKYKAPVEFTKGVIEKFSKVSEPIQTTQKFMENAEKIQKLVRGRENKLDQAWEKAKGIMESIEQSYNNQKEQLGKLHNSMSTIDTPQTETIVKQIITEAEGVVPKLGHIIEETNILLNEAEHSNVELEQVIGSEEPKNNGASEVFTFVELLNDHYFIKYKSEMAEVFAFYSAYAQQLTGFIPDPDTLIALEQKNEQVYSKAKQWFTAREAEAEERRKKYDDLESMQEQEQQRTKSMMDKAKSNALFNSCALNEDEQHYEKLEGEEGLYRKYLHFNQHNDSMKMDPTVQLDSSPELIGKSSVSMLTGLIDIWDKLTEELYINEYALTNFNYRTLNSSPSLGHRPLTNQEVEYLIYGLQSCAGNISAAYAELFMLRLGIRTVEALLDPKRVVTGSPMLVFLTALAEGAAKAYSDMESLLKGEAVPVTTNLSTVKLTYKDYLRLLLFLHSNDKKKMSRMQALIHLNTGSDLSSKSVYMQSIAETNVSLWFIPGVIKALSIAGVIDGKVDGHRYEIRKSAVMSY